MKVYIAILAILALGVPRIACADEDVQPHLFDDLNGNGISDQQENQGASSSQATHIEDITLPDTPPDEGGGE